MKKSFVLTVALLFIASFSYAQFVPTTMTIDAPDVVNYDFDGSNVDIPVTIGGAPANVIFAVYTKDQGESIGWVKNGYLDWHYVNRIDTCVFYTTGTQLGIGASSLTWDGKNQDGNNVDAGEYYYYLFGYDYMNFKVKVVQNAEWIIQTWSACKYADHEITEYDYEGTPYTQPVIYFDTFNDGRGDYGIFGYDGDTGKMSRSRWYIGNDPQDTALMETTMYDGVGSEHNIFEDPYSANHHIVSSSGPELVTWVRRIEWVAGGESVVDTDWGDDGAYTYNTRVDNGWDQIVQAAEYAGDDMVMLSNTSHYGFSTEAEIIVMDVTDGTMITSLDMAEWWVDPDDAAAGGQQSGGPNQFNVRDGRVLLASHGSCNFQCIMPTRGIDDEADWMLWYNGNGDIIGDRNNEEGSDKAWVCIDYTAVPNTYTIKQDGNYFTAVPTYGLGNTSMALFGPDGTGIAYYTFAGEGSGPKHQTDFVDYGSAYDGIYCDFKSTINQGDEVTADTGGVWYLAHNSFKGVITNADVGVDAEVPAENAVAQNSPNPFNPTTTISYTVAEAGIVSVDIFNVAGQKVDTVVNDFIDAGSHSVVWDASDFSAGVYFYTVKSGDFSKTMKMTLVK